MIPLLFPRLGNHLLVPWWLLERRSFSLFGDLCTGPQDHLCADLFQFKVKASTMEHTNLPKGCQNRQ